ncbi:MAG TPA: TonB-dependent receptor [Burkholderiales bacterium]|nr:TonB-dependent receptor [Burkholderiales bacterium]
MGSTSRRNHLLRTTVLATATAFGGIPAVDAALAAQEVDPFALSPEELFGATVVSVSKMPENLSDAPAAIYVITHDEIVRSGATYLPEILRLAPNLQVASSNSDFYAVTARGFNGTTANKLLVLIDGRTVYTPLYSGVFWDVQGVVPEDIDRIEVISGPGATLWGANAVNGVINIITRNSRDTQGGMVAVEGGNFENRVRMRYGGKIGDNATWRIYGTGLRRENTETPAGMPINDAWDNLQGGFRVDWRNAQDALTFQGDINDGKIDQNVPSDQKLKGHNLLGRWTRSLDESSDLQVQVYYDYSSRMATGAAGDSVSVYDLDVQHSFSFAQDHAVVWGGGYRQSEDRFTNPPAGAFFFPASRTLSVGNLFVQDTISLADDLKLTLGSKFETNNYTGFEPLPSARLSWKFSDKDLLWAAVSRAVRTPARIDRDVFQNIGSIVAIGGGPDFNDEKLIAYELGYRTQILSRATLSVSTFYNDYSSLRSLELSPAGTTPFTLGGSSGFLPVTFGNKMEGYTYGVEIWGEYSVTDWWRLTAGYNALREHLRFEPDSLDVAGIQAAGNDPKYQISLRSSMNLPYGLQLDVAVRNVGALPNPRLPGYAEADARIAWQVRKDFELSLAGFNLLHESHPEFSTVSEVPRSFVVGARWTF